MKKNRCITALLSLCLAFSSFSSSLLYAEATNNLPSVESSENYNYISFEEFSKLSEEEITEKYSSSEKYKQACGFATSFIDVAKSNEVTINSFFIYFDLSYFGSAKNDYVNFERIDGILSSAGEKIFDISDYNEKAICELLDIPDEYLISMDHSSFYMSLDFNGENVLVAPIKITLEFTNETEKDLEKWLTYMYLNPYITYCSPSYKGGGVNSTAPLSIGDINEDYNVDLSDLTSLSLGLIGDMKFTDKQILLADINSDSAINIADLALFKQYIMGEDIELGFLK